MRRPERVVRVGLAALCIAVAGWFGLAPENARAQTSEESDESERSDREKAARHFSKGGELFLKEEYERAILEFRRAYGYRKNPMILFNQAVAHARIGDFDKAIEVARRAGRGDLPKKARTKNDARLAAWRMRRRVSERTEAVSEARARAEQSEQNDKRGGSPAAPPPRASKPSGFSWLGWSGVASSIVGLGGIGYAAYVDATLADDIGAYRRAAKRGASGGYTSRRDAIERRQLRGQIALYAGGALLAAGTAAWLTDLLTRGGDETSPRVLRISHTARATGFSFRF